MAANNSGQQKRISAEALRTAELAEQAKQNGTQDGRIVIRFKDGKYVTYRDPCGIGFSQRGQMMKTENEAEAFDFGLVSAAKAEIKRMTSKLKNCDIINMDTGAGAQVEAEIQTAAAPAVKKTKRICFSQEVRKAVYRKTEGHCYLCGDFVDYDDYEIEHRIPLAGGGTNDFSNLFCSCHKCNSMKGSIAPEDLMERVAKIFIHQVREACGDDHAKQRAIEAALAMAGMGATGRN